MGYASEAVSSRHSLLQFAGAALPDFNHFRTPGADKVMVVALTTVADQFVSGYTVTEINAANHARFFKHPH